MINDIRHVVGPYHRFTMEKINLNSHAQVKQFLLANGWEPTTWNTKKIDGKWVNTSPKLTEDSFDSIQGNMGQAIAERNILTHRRKFLKNYEDPDNKGLLSFIREDGTVPASGNLCNAVTSRTTHMKAVCNVPGEDAILGKEIRSAYTVPEGYLMLGADLAAIEARIFGHYTTPYDDGYYAHLLLDGDIHSRNAQLIDSVRAIAKRFLYAILYGAGAPKLASIIGCSVAKAKKLIKNFWEGNPGLRILKKKLEEFYQRYGYILGLDGRKMFIRESYKLLNSLVQSAAAIVFKRWGIIANARLKAADNSCSQIIAMHDEFDYRICPDDVNEAESIIKGACTDAGKFYNLRVPVEADVKVGLNWYEIH